MNTEISSVCFTGPQPEHLYDYKSYKDWQPLIKIIYNLCKTLYKDYGTRTFITGGKQGVDQIAFWAVQWLKSDHNDIYNIIYLPGLGQESRWIKYGAFGQRDYNKMLHIADDYMVLADKPSPQAMANRDRAMVEDTKAVVSIWNGDAKYSTTERVKCADALQRPMIRIDTNTLTTTWVRK